MHATKNKDIFLFYTVYNATLEYIIQEIGANRSYSDSSYIKIFLPTPQKMNPITVTNIIHKTQLFNGAYAQEYIADVSFPTNKQTNEYKGFCFVIAHNENHRDVLIGTAINWTRTYSTTMKLSKKFAKPDSTE